MSRALSLHHPVLEVFLRRKTNRNAAGANMSSCVLPTPLTGNSSSWRSTSIRVTWLLRQHHSGDVHGMSGLGCRSIWTQLTPSPALIQHLDVQLYKRRTNAREDDEHPSGAYGSMHRDPDLSSSCQ